MRSSYLRIFHFAYHWDKLNLLDGVGARKPSESSFLQERIRGKWSEISLNVLQTDTLLIYSFILQLNKTWSVQDDLPSRAHVKPRPDKFLVNHWWDNLLSELSNWDLDKLKSPTRIEGLLVCFLIQLVISERHSFFLPYEWL